MNDQVYEHKRLCILKYETAAARLVIFNADNTEHWFPKKHSRLIYKPDSDVVTGIEFTAFFYNQRAIERIKRKKNIKATPLPVENASQDVAQETMFEEPKEEPKIKMRPPLDVGTLSLNKLLLLIRYEEDPIRRTSLTKAAIEEFKTDLSLATGIDPDLLHEFIT